jgi:hypothetical protein
MPMADAMYDDGGANDMMMMADSAPAPAPQMMMMAAAMVCMVE